jgi:hypothetical protein
VKPIDVLAEAMGVLEEWIGDYTTPDENGIQHRIRLIDSDDSSILVSVEPATVLRDPDETERFRIHLRVVKGEF